MREKYRWGLVRKSSNPFFGKIYINESSLIGVLNYNQYDVAVELTRYSGILTIANNIFF